MLIQKLLAHVVKQSLRQSYLGKMTRFNSIERLESRMLFSAVEWTGGGDGVTWNNPDNWADIITHNNPLVAPNSADAHVIFNDVHTLAITMDVSPTIFDLKVHGNSDVTLNFNDTNHALTLQYDSDAHAGGNIFLDQTANHQTKLTLATNSATQLTSIGGVGVLVTGDAAGSSALAVQTRTVLSLSDNLDSSHFQFSLTVSGKLAAENAFLTGKDLPASGPGATSSELVTGELLLSGELRIGGHGRTYFTSDHGYVNVQKFGLYNGSYLELTGRGPFDEGMFHFAEGGVIGSPLIGAVGAFIPAAGLLSQPAATVIVNHQGRLSGDGDLIVNGGDGTKLNVSSGGNFSLLQHVLIIGSAANVDAKSPEVNVVGEEASVPSRLTSGGILMVNAGLEPAGKLSVDFGGIVTTQNAQLWSKSNTGGIKIAHASEFNVTEFIMGRAGGSGGYANFEIEDAILRLTAPAGLTGLYLGDGHTQAVLNTGKWGQVDTSGAIIFKDFKSDIRGSGFIGPAVIIPPPPPIPLPPPFSVPLPILKALAPHADVIPGDYVIRDDQGQLIVDSAASDAFGTLTINGGFDASLGFTLDSVLGSSGQSNLLAVTGTATFGGAFSGQIAAFLQTPSAIAPYTEGATFTILTAADISGGFNDFTWGDAILNDPHLPKLAPNLFWTLDKVAVTGGYALQLRVSQLHLNVTVNSYSKVTIGADAPANLRDFRVQEKRPGDANFRDVGALNAPTPAVRQDLDANAAYGYRIVYYAAGKTYTSTDVTATTQVDAVAPPQLTNFSATWTGQPGTPTHFHVDGYVGFDRALELQAAPAESPNDWNTVDAYPALGDTNSDYRSWYRGFPNSLLRVRQYTMDANGIHYSPWSSVITLTVPQLSPISAPTISAVQSISGGYHLALDGVPATTGGVAGSGVQISAWARGVANLTLSNWTQAGGHAEVDVTTPNAIMGLFVTRYTDQPVLVGNYYVYTSDFVLAVAPTIAAPEILQSTLANKAEGLTWWDESVGETGYEVWRSRDGAPWVKMATLGADATGYVDPHPDAGHTYQYKVLAKTSALASLNIATANQVIDKPVLYTAVDPSDDGNGHAVYTLTISSNDPDVLTSGTMTIDWGDGTKQVIHGAPPEGIDHTYASLGTYVPTVTLADALHLLSGESMIVSQATQRFDSLDIQSLATLDIGVNRVIVETTPETKAAILAALRANVAAGLSTSTQLTSLTTSLDTTHKTTVVVDNALLGLTMFDGMPVDANALLVMSTYKGDTNLDRKVNVTDLGALSTHYGGTTTKGIVDGDFDGSGTVNVADLGIIATCYGMGTSGVPFEMVVSTPIQVGSVEDDGGTGLLVHFNYAVTAADWTPAWFELRVGGVYTAGTTVTQVNATTLLFDNVAWGVEKWDLRWRLVAGPFNVLAPATGIVT